MICKLVKHANKILYVGAGCHIQPVNHFYDTKQFIFIDTQPRNEFDSYHPKYSEGLYRPNFLTNLLTVFENNGFLLESYKVVDSNYHKKIISKTWYYSSWFFKVPYDVNPTLLVFFNKTTLQQIKYYISTNIKFNMNTYLLNDIKTCDGLIVSGYFPEFELLQYLDIPMVFFGYTGTSYYMDPQSYENNLLYFLHNFICNRQYFFTEFYVVYNDSGVIIKCQNFKNFIEILEEYKNFIENDLNLDS
jgi:hypothetical protein